MPSFITQKLELISEKDKFTNECVYVCVIFVNAYPVSEDYFTMIYYLRQNTKHCVHCVEDFQSRDSKVSWESVSKFTKT